MEDKKWKTICRIWKEWEPSPNVDIVRWWILSTGVHIAVDTLDLSGLQKIIMGHLGIKKPELWTGVGFVNSVGGRCSEIREERRLLF